MTDNNAIMGAARYTWDPFKFFGGYEYIWQNNPTDPLGVGASDQGGYIMSGVEDNNLDSEKLVQIWWTGVKYAYDRKTDITFAWYEQRQNDLPSSADLLDRSRFPQFLRGRPRRGVALCGSSLHQAFRRFCRTCVFLRDRRSGHRHSSWPRRPLSPQQQLCSDSRWSFHLLIASAAGSVESPHGLWFIKASRRVRMWPSRGSQTLQLLEKSRTDGIDTNEMRCHGPCVFITAIMPVPLSLVVFLERRPQECHDQLVVRRREMQQTAGAAHRFCVSTKVPGVLAAERFL